MKDLYIESSFNKNKRDKLVKYFDSNQISYKKVRARGFIISIEDDDLENIVNNIEVLGCNWQES